MRYWSTLYLIVFCAGFVWGANWYRMNHPTVVIRESKPVPVIVVELDKPLVC